MRRIRLIVEYDGSAFHGWQSQKNSANVQDLITDKLAILLKDAPKVMGSGRTDAGVHARGQVAAFSTSSDKDCAQILKGLNGLLPQAVRIRSCDEAPEVFDPRRDAIGKTYRYTFFDGPALPPFWKGWAWYARHPLDDAAMARAAKFLEGEHDFSSFRAAACEAKTPVRRIHHARITRKGERITFEIRGSAFLQQMVRIIAGTLFDVGSGTRTPESMQALLAAKDRKKAGKTAPPEGLVLWEVEYGAIPRPGRNLRGKPVPNSETEEDELE
jgi:tRNA pseudouridine38-40 synthase